jgi:hypothetical protein
MIYLGSAIVIVFSVALIACLIQDERRDDDDSLAQRLAQAWKRGE